MASKTAERAPRVVRTTGAGMGDGPSALGPRLQAELGTKLGTGPHEPLGILAAGIWLRDTLTGLGGGNGRFVFDPECPMNCGRARPPGQDALHSTCSGPNRADMIQHNTEGQRREASARALSRSRLSKGVR